VKHYQYSISIININSQYYPQRNKKLVSSLSTCFLLIYYITFTQKFHLKLNIMSEQRRVVTSFPYLLPLDPQRRNEMKWKWITITWRKYTELHRLSVMISWSLCGADKHHTNNVENTSQKKYDALSQSALRLLAHSEPARLMLSCTYIQRWVSGSERVSSF